MANDHFNTGDSVVYPGHGVGTVVGRKWESVGNQNAEFLVVAFALGMTLRIPVGNIKKSGLRGISSRGVMQNVLTVFSEPRSQKKSMWRHRALEYAAKIKTGDPRAIAQIVRDLHRAPGESEGSFSEKAVYQQAWDHFIPELAAVDRTDNEAAAKKVAALLEAA
jgi:CarD family transcriptional regulator